MHLPETEDIVSDTDKWTKVGYDGVPSWRTLYVRAATVNWMRYRSAANPM